MGLPARKGEAARMQAALQSDCPATYLSSSAGTGSTRLNGTQPNATDPGVTNWTFDNLRGVLTELSSQGGQAQLSLAFSLVLDAQRQKETVAWVTDSHSSFFPPDVADAGIDLAALAVIRLPGVRNQLKGADRLVRSGGFGMVVLDLGADPRVPAALVARLAGLARKHDTVVLCLTDKRRDAASLGARVAIRGEARRTRQNDGLYNCQVDVFRDRRLGSENRNGRSNGKGHRSGNGWVHEEVLRGPEGLG